MPTRKTVSHTTSALTLTAQAVVQGMLSLLISSTMPMLRMSVTLTVVLLTTMPSTTLPSEALAAEERIPITVFPNQVASLRVDRMSLGSIRPCYL